MMNYWKYSQIRTYGATVKTNIKIIPVGSPNIQIDNQLNLSLLEHENSKIISSTISIKGCNKLTNVKCQNITPICVWLHIKLKFILFFSCRFFHFIFLLYSYKKII